MNISVKEALAMGSGFAALFGVAVTIGGIMLYFGRLDQRVKIIEESPITIERVVRLEGEVKALNENSRVTADNVNRLLTEVRQRNNND